MPTIPAAVRRTACALAVVLGVLPPLGYWLLADREQTASPQQAKAMADRSLAAALSVDVRDDVDLPFRGSTLIEQWALVLTGFVVKPAYSVLSLALAIVLWRSKAADLAALRWAMVAFFVGENCCAANYLAYDDRSCALEYLHCYGMVLCFALTTFALLEAFDHRLLKFSDPQGRCAALGLCRRCIKHADVPCGLKRTFLFLIPAAAVLCGMPLTAPYALDSYNTRVLGTLYNLGHPVVYQVFEVRYLPATALGLLAASLSVLLWKKNEPVLWSKLLFAAGVGALGFSLFRMVLLQSYRDARAWFSVWEEVTEMLFIAGAALVLWLFRHGLLAAEADSA